MICAIVTIALSIIGFNFLAKAESNPCNDTLYLELKAKDVNKMTDREYEVFKTRDSACQDYQRKGPAEEAQAKAAESTAKSSESMHNAISAATIGYVILMGVLVLVLLGA
jgi:hypothetical protein